MNKNNTIPFALMTFSLLFTACGKDGGSMSNASKSHPGIQEQQAEGRYRAILRPLNNSLSGFLPTGTADIKIIQNDVSVKTLLDDDARVAHIQSIHLSSRCPNTSDDSNRDGVIDINEAYKVTGEILIPLDAGLDSAVDGQGVYPVGTGFTYMENTTLDRLETDTKSRTGQNLNLGGRVVLIHGVANGTSMPGTVTTKDEFTPQASVPIACGILKRI